MEWAEFIGLLIIGIIVFLLLIGIVWGMTYEGGMAKTGCKIWARGIKSQGGIGGIVGPIIEYTFCEIWWF